LFIRRFTKLGKRFLVTSMRVGLPALDS
jgi:hypothetical protein